MNDWGEIELFELLFGGGGEESKEWNRYVSHNYNYLRT